MLNHISISSYTDLGQLAEIMLFYGKITLFINERQIRNLFQQVDPKVLIPFFEEHKESIDLRCITWGVWASEGYKSNNLMKFGLGDEATLQVDEPYLEYLWRTSILDTPGGYIEDKILTRRFLDMITRVDTQYNTFKSIFEEDVIKSKLPEFVKRYTHNVNTDISARLPHFTISSSKSNHTLSSFDVKINLRSKKIQNIRLIKDAILLYVQINAILPIWAELSSEILTDNRTSFVIKSTINNTLNQKFESHHFIDHFQEIFVPDAKKIREVINNGEKSFADFLKVYEKGKKFRDWIQDRPIDGNLLREYYQSITKDSWVDKLPTKTARWGLFTGAGLGIDMLGAGGIGTLTGVALGAFDEFVLDKLIKGWKPSQFIDEDVKTFLSS